MNELERELRVLFEEKTTSLGHVPGPSGSVLRRGRRRQRLSVAGGIGATLLVAAVTVVAIKGLAPDRQTPATAPPGYWTTGGQLQTQAEAGALVATFQAFGQTWKVRDDMLGTSLEQVGGVARGNTSLLRYGGEVQIDVPGGTIFLAQEGTDIHRVSVGVDGGGTVEGRWMTMFRDDLGHPGRLWIVPLPGTGHGVVQIGSGTHLRHLVSWPGHVAPQPGDVVMSVNGPGLSWALTWSTSGCPVVRVLAPAADAGSSQCLAPWDRSGYKGVSLVSGRYGSEHAAVALVGPTSMNVDLTGSGGIGLGAPACIDMTAAGWVGTQICVIPMLVGDVRTAVVSDSSGGQLGPKITLTASPGLLHVSEH